MFVLVARQEAPRAALLGFMNKAIAWTKSEVYE
jgi:hypothetical protein